MDLLYVGNVDAFALVSSDSDFTRLATRLRESGKTVYGLGQRKTPASCQAACDKFIFLEVLRDVTASNTDGRRGRRRPGADSLPDLRTVQVAPRSAAPRHATTGGHRCWCRRHHVGKAHAARPRQYGCPGLGDARRRPPPDRTTPSGGQSSSLAAPGPAAAQAHLTTKQPRPGRSAAVAEVPRAFHGAGSGR